MGIKYQTNSFCISQIFIVRIILYKNQAVFYNSLFDNGADDNGKTWH